RHKGNNAEEGNAEEVTGVLGKIKHEVFAEEMLKVFAETGGDSVISIYSCSSYTYDNIDSKYKSRPFRTSSIAMFLIVAPEQYILRAPTFLAPSGGR
ncbi:hypothetical protein LTR86_011337, partial [Recurvomyces mirabilis]